MADWEAEGLLEGLDPAERAARIELLEMLEAEGCPMEDIKRSHRDGELLFLLAGRAIDVNVTMTWDQVVERSGMPEDLVERFARSQGLTRSYGDEVAYGEADLQMLLRCREFLDAGLPEDEVVAVGRLLGRGFSQAAEVMRGIALRIILEPGLSERELATRYAHTAAALTPMIEPLLGNLLRLHLSKLLQTELISAEERQAGRIPGARPMTIAFADLVGFTRLGEALAPDELGAVAERLEQLVVEVIEPPARFIKTIGDAVMLVSPEPEPLIETGLALVERADIQGESFPQLRVGLAGGPALSRAGDWFGHPVNLASRVTNVARPGSVLTTDAVQEAAPERFHWSKAGIRRLKGIDDPVALWRARRADDAARGA